MQNYIPLSTKFETGIIITGLTSDPYAFRFEKGILIDSIYLNYEMDTKTIDEAIRIVEKKWNNTKRVTYDSSNLINPVKTIIKKVLTLN